MSARKTVRRGGSAVTAQDVARRAGVSPMTVSRVINGDKNVRDSTREAVLTAARELSYAPNLAARSLASAEQPRIGLPYANPSSAYLSEFLVGMLDEVGRRGAQLALVRCETGDAETERAAVRQLLAGQVSGVLLTSPLSDSAPAREEIFAAGLPAVAVGAAGKIANLSSVRIDDRKAAYEMTEFLIRLGHRRIGFISGHPNQAATGERLAGFGAALRELAPDAEKTVAQGYFNYQSGLVAAEELLEAKKRPSAIFASNDDMAAAVVSVAHRRGLDVPRDLTVVGFDDTALATTLWPELTTVRQPIGEMAAAGVKLLLAEMRASRDGSAPAPTTRVMLHGLVKRQSHGPPPRKA